MIYESEDWIDYHDARNEGPTATGFTTVPGDIHLVATTCQHVAEKGLDDAVVLDHEDPRLRRVAFLGRYRRLRS